MLTRIENHGRQLVHGLARRVPPLRRLAEQRSAAIGRATALEADVAELRRRLVDVQRELDSWRATGIKVEYGITPRVRDWSGTAGGAALAERIASGDAAYAQLLEEAAETAQLLTDVPVELPDAPTDPHWYNGFLPPGDAIFLTHFLRTLAPKTYLEIGSGNSTKFARRAIRTYGLPTRIVSIDPSPRAEIDEICDEVVRATLESSDALAIFRTLQPGDLVFFDGSHYCFQNSDVTAFFMELVHEIPEGCVYGIHDIFLPDDYPEAWFDRFYNEQYVLAAWLLGGAAGDQIELPGWYVSTRPQFADAQARLLEVSGAGPDRHGGAFWMRRGGAGRRE